MAKFGINDILNAKTKAAGQQAQGYKEIYLSPYEVKAAEENTHQKLEGIEELADSFLHVGQEQPTVLARVNGEYRIIDGHRRNEANKLNLERGHKEYEKVLFRSKDMSEASKINEALGIELWIWQKTYMTMGTYRQMGATTAQCLRVLLFSETTPLDYSSPPRTAREDCERQQLREIYQKLNEAGIQTRKVFWSREEKRRWYESQTVEKEL